MIPQNKQISDFTSFEAEGLNGVEKVIFTRKNLIIGKNGSGKTRFLKALEREKKGQDKNDVVITLYFPEIHSFYNAGLSESQSSASEDPATEVYPYDLLFENEDHSFYDFLKIMENDRGDFLENILTALSMRRAAASAKAKKTFEELNDILSEFLEKRLYIKKDENKIYIEKMVDDTVTRQLPLKEALSEFSPGELMLFYLSVFLITVKKKSAKSVVLIIDEPELHLHPRALIKMVKTLTAFESVSELWIASHSLFLVPLFSFEEIVFMQQGNVLSRNSQTYKELYDSLVGLENINVFEFLKSIENWQYYQFIVECFCLPASVEKYDIKDEQFCKLLESVRKNMKLGPIRMLDYGAGKYRIWECIQLLPDSEILKKNIIYSAYEPYPEQKDIKSFTLYTTFEKICTKEKIFHVVVLMNVLHEIEISKWLDTFQCIQNILTDDGVLVFLEVLSLSKGEQPYGDNGYLVLQDKQIKILFNDSNIVNMRKGNKEKSNCWMVTKKQVGNVTNETIKESIISLRDSSYHSLKEEYQNKIDFAHQKEGNQKKQTAARKYAFLSQQYINAKIALDITESPTKIQANTIKVKSGDFNTTKPSIKVTALKESSDI